MSNCRYLVSLALLAVGLGAAAGPLPAAAVTYEGDLRKFERIERDVAYGEGGGETLRLDLFHPVPARTKPVPAVVFIHGGGWRQGDKRNGYGAAFARRGYLFATINYRLAPAHRFPAPLEDVKCALRFLRAHASQYGLDPRRIGLWGNSAGAHLAALAAFTPGRLEGAGGWKAQRSDVQAVVDFFGPMDLTAPGYHPAIRDMITSAFGATPELWRYGSPLRYAHAGAPPFQIWHGRKDTVVPLSQSVALHQRLRALGVPSELQIVDKAGHGFPPGSEPGPDVIDARVDAFLDRLLKPEGPRP